MKIYELFLIFLIGTALGVIVRYIAGYRRRHISYATLNVILGGAACITSCALYGGDYFELFLSGAGGVIANFAYKLIKLFTML